MDAADITITATVLLLLVFCIWIFPFVTSAMEDHKRLIEKYWDK